MALTQAVINESEIAKNYVMNSDLDEDYKETLIDLINTSMIATNGISPEEKIQKMTNSIQKLAISQVGLIKSIKQIIQETLKTVH